MLIIIVVVIMFSIIIYTKYVIFIFEWRFLSDLSCCARITRSSLWTLRGCITKE